MALRGKFRPINPHKYLGNVNNIVYRSSWELTFMKCCDTNTSVLKWGSEELHIPYFFPPDRKWHRYFPDFLMKVRTKTGGVETWLVEVKPSAQTRIPTFKPNASSRRVMKESLTYAKNQAKWKAASEYCQARGWIFRILTEKDIFPGS